jgi:type II secretory pathway component PulK
VLIVTMVVVFAIAALVLTMSRNVRVEAGVSANALATLEADAIVRGAEQFVMSVLTDQRDSLADIPESDFEAVPVGRGWFWVVRPDFDDSALASYGLVDEASKLHLNVAGYERLRLVPGLTDPIAASIVDWRDEDDTPTESGAESAQYLSRQPPSNAKNSAFEAVEELALVHGMTGDLLYGTPGATAGESSSTISFSSDRYLEHGVFDYFTVWNSQPNTAADGTRRVSLNGAQNRDQLRQVLRTRISQARGDEIVNRLGTSNVSDLFDFANRVQLETDELEQIEDYVTTANPQQPLRGRINVNTAPRDVLLTLEGLSSSDVDSLLARRPSAVADNPASIAWVYDVLKERAVGLGNQVAGTGRQYSADLVALAGNGRAFRRVRVVIDTTPTPPRVVYRRDWTDRGWPLDPQILEDVRAGRGVSGSTGLGGFGGLGR